MLAPWEQGLRIRLGKNVVRLQPGFNWVIPGIDRVSVQTTRLRVCTLQVQNTLSTRDKRTLVLAANVGYAIADILRLYDTLHHAEDTIKAIVAEAIAEAVRSLDSPTPEQVSSYAVQKLARLQDFGLADISVTLTDFAFVRVYRLIADQKWGGGGDALTTNIQPNSQVPR